MARLVSRRSAAPASALARLGALAGAALLLGGCPRPPVVRPYPPPSAAELLAGLAAHQAAVRGVDLRVRATSYLGGERVRATVQILAERVGRLRLEAEVALQGTVAVLTVDGPRFALLDVPKNRLARGPSCPANVASLVRIPLSPPEVAALLLGDVRAPDVTACVPGGEGTIGWDPGTGTDVLTLAACAGAPGMRLAWKGDPGHRHLVAVTSAGWRVAYDDFEAVGGATLPRLLQFAEAGASFDDGVEIKIKERTVNPTPPDGAFRIEPPEGVTIQDIGCGG